MGGKKKLAEQPKNDLSLRDSVYTVVAIPGSSENAKIEQPHAFSCLEKVAPRGRKRGGTKSDPAPPHTRQGFALPPSPRRGFFLLICLGCAEPP